MIMFSLLECAKFRIPHTIKFPSLSIFSVNILRGDSEMFRNEDNCLFMRIIRATVYYAVVGDSVVIIFIQN